ncbi:DGQHR domain-containing protein DpdB [Vibrio renipiscarius]|uniref:DGQHR domain-containing protein DpdB n=1 Tax=Vibrio renipiscarius TaxID=1461322 RepID=UPI0035509870
MKKKALKIRQSCGVELYQVNMNLEEIESISSISRIFRSQNKLEGYQRPEVRNHINNIAAYIESDGAVIPNSIIMSLTRNVKRKKIDEDLYEITIPKSKQSAVLVDGQQRVAALKLANKPNFYLPVCLFISDDVNFDRQQFLLINSAKPLSKSLIYELLPHANGVFSQELTRRKLPSLIVQLLNYEKKSPLNGLIKVVTNPGGLIADNSLMKMVDNSLREGALYAHSEVAKLTYDAKDCQIMLEMLYAYFAAVRDVFAEDWGKRPKESRLFHGAGIIALGQLFDEIYYSFLVSKQAEPFYNCAQIKLSRIKPYCRWSDGVWEFGPDADGQPIVKKWNQIQNLSQDISLVTDYLVRLYDLQEREVVLVKSQ